MARIRSVKPQFFMNEELAELPAMVRLLFIGLWTQADREGRLIDRPKRLKAEIFPYETFEIEKGLNQLSDAGFIFRYKVKVNATGRVLAPEQPITELAIIQIINFSRHQKIDKVNEKESDLPPPLNGVVYKKTIDSLPKVGEGKGKEGKEVGATNDPFFEMFRSVSGKHITDEQLFTEMAKFKNKYPNAHPNRSGALVNAWVANIGREKPNGTKEMVV